MRPRISTYEVESVGRSVGRFVGRMVRNQFSFSHFLYENYRGSPTLTFLNVLGVLNVLNVLHVLNMSMDASLACRALFSSCLVQSNTIGMPK